MDDNFVPALGKTLYSDGFRKGTEATSDGIQSDRIRQATSDIYDHIDQLNHLICNLAANKNTPPQCKMGCGYCCHQPVYASTHEIEYLIDYLQKNSDRIDLSQILLRARNKYDHLKKLSNDELKSSKYPCPLLDKDACLAYQARPVACRIYLSFSVKSCIDFFEKPEQEASIPNLMEFPLKMGRMLNEGFIAGLKLNGYQPREVRIEEGLLGILDQGFPPDLVVEI